VLRAAARTNLLLLGVPAAQVADIEKTRHYTTNYVVTAPQDGFVLEKIILPGQKVEAGMKLYRLADLGTVWVQAQIYEQDLPFVSLGQEADVSLSYLPDRKFRGRVTYIYPTLDEKTRTAKVRLEFQNPGYLLKPGMFATVELKAELAADAVLVPDSAVLRSGEKNTAFVALAGGKFEPRNITLGPRGEGNVYQVLSGLKEGERVVTSGQFMLDSESQLREAVQKMLGASVDKPDDGAHGVTRPTSEIALPKLYTCPMASHADVVTDKPGDCPKCGMTLVPTSEVAHGKVAEANWSKQHQH
jgi:RND family efflux transporter MFP subunit